eukprot:CAMPEP_0172447132 /NCGR_PEP_ID=MMETSP1065-20121228/6504_1 /TAXON_ID=265537 /ORGANISM="Amphiprora paludosa, Strain CCMP125" /LENGTH=201 /DNA_ID=CAMNT_0013198355 /DNA_START=55 /DNA_END=660 /DNA_ORIENTATION=+
MKKSMTAAVSYLLCLLFGPSFVSGQSTSDERCNICGCNLNECTFGQNTATLKFDYGGQPYSQNCAWINDQINRPNSPFDLNWCINDLPPIVLNKCACFYRATGDDVPVPAPGSTPAPDPFNGGPAPSPGNPGTTLAPALGFSGGGAPPCIPNSPGCDSVGQPTTGGGSSSGAYQTKPNSILVPSLVGFVAFITACWTLWLD